MLFLLSFVTPDAEACSPGIAEILSSAPVDGAVDVPRDARLVLTMGNGYIEMYDEPMVELWVDGAQLAGSQQLWERTMDLTSQTGQIIFTPELPFEAGVEVEARLMGFGWKGETMLHHFTVGEGMATPAPGAPSMRDVSVTHVINDESYNSCSAPEWREARIKVAPAAGTADPNAWLLVYRSDAGVVADSPFGVLGPLVDDSELVLDTRSFYDIDRELSEECYTVAQVDAAGTLSWAEETRCHTVDPEVEEDEDPGFHGGGCATVAPVGGALALLLAGLPLLRRRRPR